MGRMKMSKLDDFKKISAEEDLLIKIKLTLDDAEVMCAVVDTFSVDRTNYIVFLPLDVVDPDICDLLIFRLLSRDTDTIKYEAIDNDEEFYRVIHTYDALLHEEPGNAQIDLQNAIFF